MQTQCSPVRTPHYSRVSHRWHPTSTQDRYPWNSTLHNWQAHANKILHTGSKKDVLSIVGSTQLGFLKVLCKNKATQWRQLPSIRPHTPQWEKCLQQQQFALSPLYNCSHFVRLRTTVHPLQDHSATISPLQGHTQYRISEEYVSSLLWHNRLYARLIPHYTQTLCPTSATWKTQSPNRSQRRDQGSVKGDDHARHYHTSRATNPFGKFHYLSPQVLWDPYGMSGHWRSTQSHHPWTHITRPPH